MTDYANLYEFVASGTAVTTTNSGASGDSWLSVTLGTGGAITYDNTHVAYGLTACKIVTGTTATYNEKAITAATVNANFRQAYYFTANPTTGTTPLIGWFSAATFRTQVAVDTTGHLVVTGPGGTLGTSSFTIPLNQWFEIEFGVVGATGTGGSFTLKLYNTLGLTTASNTLSVSSINTGGTATRVRIGACQAAGGTQTYWMDQPRFNDTGAAIGPVVTVKAEIGGWNPTGGLATGSFSLPAGLAVGDPLFILMASNGAGMALSSVPAGWTVLGGPATVNTLSWMLLKRNTGWQTADGTSLSLTFTGNVGVAYSSFGLDGTLYSPDAVTLGALGDRASSVTTTVAASAGAGASPTLVLAAEKAASHSGQPDRPTITPTTVLASWRADSSASSSSTYVGMYTGSAASRTLTYSAASLNATAFQLVLNFAVGVATLSGAGSLGAVGTPAVPGTPALGGNGSLSTTATPAVPGAAALGGTGSLSAPSAPSFAAAAALSGAGTLAATGVPAEAGTAPLTGSGTLAAVGGPITTAGSANLAGAGSLTAAGAPATTTSAALTGSGTLTTATSPSFAGAAGLSSSGALTTQATAAAADTAGLAGDGTLTAVGATARHSTGTADLAGAGTLTSSAQPATSTTASLAGPGSLSASTTPGAAQAAALSGVGTLAAVTAAQLVGAATLAGLGQLTALGVLTIDVGAALSGVGTLVGAGRLPEPTPPERIWIVPAQNRGWAIPGDDRTWAVGGDNRLWPVPARDRSWAVPADDRTWEIT